MDLLGANSWSFEKGDFLLINAGNYAVYQKPSGEIRIIEIEGPGNHGVNRSPMYLEEVLIRELVEYKKAEIEVRVNKKWGEIT